MGLTGDGDVTPTTLWELGGREAIAEHLRELADERLDAREAEVGEDDWAQVERFVLLRTIDSLWVEHLTELDDMRRGIGLRGYAQQDPLNEFRREAFRMYEELRGLIRHEVASSIFRVTVQKQPPPDVGAGPVARPGRGGRWRARLGDGDGARRRAAAAAPAAGAPRPPGSAILRGRCRGAGGAQRARVARRPAGRPAAPGRAPAGGAGPATRRRAPGSGATTRAGAGPARSTRSATAADRLSAPCVPSLACSSRAWSWRLAVLGYATFRIWDQGNRDERPAADAIVVLGAAQYDGRPSPVFAARLDHAVELYHAGVAPRLIVTGGKAEGDRTTEAAQRPRLRDRARRPGRARSSPRTRAGRRSSRSGRVAGAPARRTASGARSSCPTRPTCCGSCGWRRTRASRPTARRPAPARSSATRSGGSTRSSTSSARSPCTSSVGPAGRSVTAPPRMARHRSDGTDFPLGAGGLAAYTGPTRRSRTARVPRQVLPSPAALVPQRREWRESVKQAEEASFVDLIACERDCRTCSYAAALDCDGNCGVCPHNGYCPCVNPVVARSKTALRLIELRPILLQDLQARN